MAPDLPLTEGSLQPSSARADAASDGRELSEIFHEYGAFVWRTLRHLGVRESDLPDLCQEVFLVVHRRLSSFEGRSALSTWLYGICYRTASDHRRRAHVRREVSVPDVPGQDAEPTQHKELERKQLRQRLLALLDELDADKRAVVVLYEIEGLAMSEIAEIVGCPLQTAYSRLHAGRKLLAERLGRQEAP